MVDSVSNPQARGAAFEKEIADLLSLRGFRLIEDFRSAGFRADFIVTRGQEPFKEFYVVEVKDQERPVGNDAVLKLGGAVSGFRKTYNKISGLLVSKSGFTADAKKAAESIDNIKITTYEQ